MKKSIKRSKVATWDDVKKLFDVFYDSDIEESQEMTAEEYCFGYIVSAMCLDLCDSCDCYKNNCGYYDEDATLCKECVAELAAENK